MNKLLLIVVGVLLSLSQADAAWASCRVRNATRGVVHVQTSAMNLQVPPGTTVTVQAGTIAYQLPGRGASSVTCGHNAQVVFRKRNGVVDAQVEPLGGGKFTKAPDMPGPTYQSPRTTSTLRWSCCKTARVRNGRLETVMP